MKSFTKAELDKLHASQVRKRKGRKQIQSRKVEIDGIMFDSLAESKRYRDLAVLQAAGEVFNLEVHPKYRLEVNGQLITTYKPDFKYHDNNANLIVEDVKGLPKTKKAEKYMKGTANWTRFRLCCKLMKALHGIDVVVVYE